MRKYLKSDAQRRKEQIIALARVQHRHLLREGTFEIDGNALVSETDDGDNGAYAQAWVWVDFSGTELDKETEET